MPLLKWKSPLTKLLRNASINGGGALRVQKISRRGVAERKGKQQRKLTRLKLGIIDPLVAYFVDDSTNSNYIQIRAVNHKLKGIREVLDYIDQCSINRSIHQSINAAG